VIAKDKFVKYPGGAPANVACALAKLGIQLYISSLSHILLLTV